MHKSTVQISKLDRISSDFLRSPHSVCLMEESNCLMTIDRSQGNVCKAIELTTSKLLFSFGSYGHKIGEFSYPITSENIGSIMAVADYLRTAIILFSREGDLVSEIDLKCFAKRESFSESNLRPWCLCYSVTSSSLYGAFMFANTIFKLSSENPFRITFGKSILKQPLGVCVGKNETVFVIDKTTCITCFQEDGGVLGKIELNKIDAWCSETIVRFTIDLRGNFIISPSSLNLILVFSPEGEQLFPTCEKDRSIFSFDNPLNVTLSSGGDLLAVSDTYNGLIELFRYSCE